MTKPREKKREELQAEIEDGKKKIGSVKSYAQICFGIWQKSITGGRLNRPLVTITAGRAQRVKGGGTPLVLPLTLCDLAATYPTSGSCSMASKCFIFMYFLLPHWVPAT